MAGAGIASRWALVSLGAKSPLLLDAKSNTEELFGAVVVPTPSCALQKWNEISRRNTILIFIISLI